MARWTNAVQAYIDGIDPDQRPLFDRVQGLILAARPDAVGAHLLRDPDLRGRRTPALPRRVAARCVALRLG